MSINDEASIQKEGQGEEHKQRPWDKSRQSRCEELKEGLCGMEGVRGRSRQWSQGSIQGPDQIMWGLEVQGKEFELYSNCNKNHWRVALDLNLETSVPGVACIHVGYTRRELAQEWSQYWRCWIEKWRERNQVLGHTVWALDEALPESETLNYLMIKLVQITFFISGKQRSFSLWNIFKQT